MKIPTILTTTYWFVPLSQQRPLTLHHRLQIHFSNINSTTWIHTQRGFEEAKRSMPNHLVHLNTYGGEVVFADSIR